MKKRIVIILIGLFIPVILLAQTTHFTFTSNTGDSYSIVIDDATLNESALSIGDEIGVFTPADLCVGASVWDGSTPLALSAWADDSQTPDTDGYQSGEAMTFKIWEQSSDQEFTATATYTIGDGNFNSGAYAQLTLSAGSETPVLPGGAIIVDNTNDTGPGSLRDAITQAINNPGPDSIKFNIPKGQPGSGYDSEKGVWVISPNSSLPTISDEGLVIDGTSQAEYIGEQTNLLGPEIMLDGSNAGASTTGLNISASGVEIIGLIIANFGYDGIKISQVEGGRISGCYIGVSSDGSEPAPNGSCGINISNTRGFCICPQDTIPNVISGNSLHGIYMVASSNNFIIRNIIGLNSSKDDTLGNHQAGIFMLYGTVAGCDSNEVIDNFIGGNKQGGIYIPTKCGNNIIINNNIGSSNHEQSEKDFGNGSCGISISSSENHIEENTIAYNSVYGVQIYGAEALRNNINRNRIFNNGWGGISNENGGNGELSPPDITSVTSSSVTGTGPANSSIEIFADEDDQGVIFLGSTMSDASGNFNFSGELPDELNITATATDSEGNTSEFSSPMQTSIQDQYSEQILREFKLYQNSPNPFNPVTVISFSLPLETCVEIEVYNLSGQKVATLVNQEMEEGFHEITFKPGNLPSGVYVYRLKTARFVQVKKMMLLK